MNRQALFCPTVEEFLTARNERACEEQVNRRYLGLNGEFTYTRSEWRQVIRPGYEMDAIPQTLTDRDLQVDTLPAPMYKLTLTTGEVYHSRIQRTVLYKGRNLTVDFMTFVKPDGTPCEEFDWTETMMDDYQPGVKNPSFHMIPETA